MEAGEGESFGEISLALVATSAASRRDLDDHGSVESAGRQLFEKGAAWLLAATGNQVLIARTPRAVGEVNVHQRITEIARHLERIALAHRRMRQVESRVHPSRASRPETVGPAVATDTGSRPRT